jgi:hypothetical protein
MLRLLVIVIALAGVLGASTREKGYDYSTLGLEAASAATEQVSRIPAQPSNCCRPHARNRSESFFNKYFV